MLPVITSAYSNPSRKRRLSFPERTTKRRKQSFSLNVGTLDVIDLEMDDSPFPQWPGDSRDKAKPFTMPDRFIKAATPHRPPLCVSPRTLRFANMATEAVVPLNLLTRLSAQSLYQTPPAITSVSASTNTSRLPYRVLDGPGLQNSFWRTLVDWSPSDIMAVALKQELFIQNPLFASRRICSLSFTDLINTVQFRLSDAPEVLGLGSSLGILEVWNVNTSQSLWKKPLQEDSEITTVSGLVWHGPLLTAGYEGGVIAQYDTRIKTASSQTRTWRAHKGESFVCGLRWNQDGHTLASGGSDHVVAAWDVRGRNQAVWKICDFKAGIKSLAWCPWKSSLLAVGGALADPTIRMYYTHHMQPKLSNTITCASGISSLHFSPHCVELLSTHSTFAYSDRENKNHVPDDSNSIQVHSYPSFKRVMMIRPAHHGCVMGSCLSPDGIRLSSNGDDECIRFWHIWDKKKRHRKDNWEEMILR